MDNLGQIMVARHQWEEDKMITASQARRLSNGLNNDNTQLLLNKANNQIENKSKEGVTNCSVGIEYKESFIVEVVIKDLMSRGFGVKREKGSDCRNDSWDYLVIQW